MKNKKLLKMGLKSIFQITLLNMMKNNYLYIYIYIYLYIYIYIYYFTVIVFYTLEVKINKKIVTRMLIKCIKNNNKMNNMYSSYYFV